MTKNAKRTGYSRREWASIAGAVVTASPLTAQQDASAGRDMLKEQREANVRAIAALQEVVLTPFDEPIFGLVVR